MQGEQRNVVSAANIILQPQDAVKWEIFRKTSQQVEIFRMDSRKLPSRVSSNTQGKLAVTKMHQGNRTPRKKIVSLHIIAKVKKKMVMIRRTTICA